MFKVLMASVAFIGGCAGFNHKDDANHIVTVSEDVLQNGPFPIDAPKGYMMNVIMTPDDTWVSRCEDGMGGEPLSFQSKIFWCEDIDH